MARTTKNDLIYEIRNAGYKANKSMTMDELQAIYDGLHVHRTPDVKPEELNNDQDEEKARIEQEGSQTIINPPEPTEETEQEPETETEETPDTETETGAENVNGEYDELLGKIGAATPPNEPKAEKDKPIVTKTRQRKKKGTSDPDSFRLEGYVLLLITDTIFPFTFAFLNNMLDKNIKVEATELQLTQKDFDKLEPLADQAADYMSVNINPVAGFALVSMFMYSNNLILLRSTKK